MTKVRVFEFLSEIPESIARRCSFPNVDNFFLSLNWFSCLYETSLRASMTPRMYCIFDSDERPLGMLFCAVKENERTLYSLTNFYTMEFGLTCLASPSLATKYMDQLVEFIESERPRWTLINFRFLPRVEGDIVSVGAVLKDKGFSVSTYLMYENWYINLADQDFDTYFSTRSSRLRNTIKRKEKKLERSHRYEIQIYTTNDLQLEEAIKEYVAIYNKSWKRPEPFPKFIPRLLTEASAIGILRLGILYVDGQSVAAQVWLKAGSKALIYKLAYDQDYAEFSPGSILSREMFRYAIDVDKVKEIDYGVGSESYKKDWMNSVREIVGLQAYNKKTIRGLSFFIFTATMRFVKQLMRKQSNYRSRTNH